ncbi:MAG: hypothetical protein Q7R89_03945 [bacterium]|nr:hypothetical protein [bacterium]
MQVDMGSRYDRVSYMNHKFFSINKVKVFFILSVLLFASAFIVLTISDECGCGFSRDLFFFNRDNGVAFFFMTLAIIFLTIGIFFTKLTKSKKVLYTIVIVLISAQFYMASFITEHKRCPDTKKIANIKSTQLDLEIFKDKYGDYPEKLDELISKFKELYTSRYNNQKALTDEYMESIHSYQKTEKGYRLTTRFVCSKNNYKIQDDINPVSDIYEVEP